MKKRFSALAVLVGLTGWLLAGCGGFLGEAFKGSGEKQVLNLVEKAEPINLDTAKLIDDSSVKIATNVLEGLMRLGPENRPEPGMAADFPKISKDKKTYTFKLRDAKWSDGRPVTAHDFEYAWKRALNPKTKSAYAFILYPIEGAEEYHTGKGSAEDVGVKALDDKTLRVRLKEPIPYFLSLTSFITYSPQRKDIVEKYGDEYAKDADKMVYNGPFVMSEWSHQNSYQFSKNGKYWDRKNVHLDEVNVRIVPDAEEAMGMYVSNQADVVMLNNDLIDAFKDTKEFVTANSGTIYFLRFNTNFSIFANKKIRQAFSLSVDREELIAKGLKDDVPAGGMVPPLVMGYEGYFRDHAKEYVKYDPEKAKGLLQEGMKELGIDTLPDIELLVYDDDRKLIALTLKEQLQKTLGVKIRINPLPQKQKFEMEEQGKFHLTFVRWTGDYNDPMTFLDMWHSKNALNFGGWSNGRYDELIERSRENPDFKKREKDLIQAEKILVEEAGAAPLYYEKEAYLQKTYVKNLVRHPVGAKYTLKWVRIEGKP
ncbi:oligopeptide transport system substrate-binding protein [Planifilum fimeticola]|uniref:Oligopeptide transport system substrate-binding protein n=1 Tax=Planifilum fimeticola TaxID=201975 RepID=A0A2T0LBQ8_9BACL|nr:peptide ABC transporter substrate-binding protein [Planifilum fimeticola]PRX39320.1 oligopeptide transport system substrate-binding protein [Planifilum fimeticola]